MNRSEQIIESWEANATNWIRTIDNNEIESRRLVTNKAIIDAVLKYHPAKLLDVGCGEGWLSRTLRSEGIDAWGTDAVQELVDAAVTKDGEFYYKLSYCDLINANHQLPGPFDGIAINFALLDKEETDSLIGKLYSLLEQEGLVFIQTLHPFIMIEKEDYVTGWKDGSWVGMKQAFTHPYPWYFRTFADWVDLFLNSGFDLIELMEPVHPDNKKPLSVIFVLKLKTTFNQ